MPPDALDHTVEVLLEFPCQPRLADAGLSHERHEASATLPARRVELLFQQSKLVGAADEWRFERVRATRAATLRDDPQCAERGHGRGFALEVRWPKRLERDRGLRCGACR